MTWSSVLLPSHFWAGEEIESRRTKVMDGSLIGEEERGTRWNDRAMRRMLEKIFGEVAMLIEVWIGYFWWIGGFLNCDEQFE